ncbi:unnamed protein product [Macrosiphum euphorbiae]|nr:unnamed protein product [Macrosiphum euphorbiae]
MELKQVISNKDEQIQELNKKLEDFDSVVYERNDLREIYKDFEQHNEKSKTDGRKLFTELLTKYELQTETLKKVANAEYQCELKNEKLEDHINCMNHQIQTLKENEDKLKIELSDFETKLKSVQNELCTIKLELEKKNSVVKKSENNFNCKEQELNKVSRELDECKTKCNKLNEMNKKLNMDLNETKEILCDTNISANHMEETFKLERALLSNELEISHNKTNDLEMRYNEAKKELNAERCTIETFYKKIKESNKVNEKTHLKTKKQLKKLNENLCCLKEKVNELEQENDCKCMEISALKSKLDEREGQLQKMNLLSEKIEQIEKQQIEACLKEKTKVNNPCELEDSPTDTCCGASNDEKAIKNNATKSNASKKNIHKILLKNLICDLGNMLQSIF